MEDNYNQEEDDVIEDEAGQKLNSSEFDEDLDPVSSTTGGTSGDVGRQSVDAFLTRAEGPGAEIREQDEGCLIDLEVPKSSKLVDSNAESSNSPPCVNSPDFPTSHELADGNSNKPLAKSIPNTQEVYLIPKKEKPTIKAASRDSCAWLSTISLPPSVWALLLWTDVPTTGGVFFATFTLLLSLAYFSAISVVAYASLGLLVAALTFKLYRLAVAAVSKDSSGSPSDFNPLRMLEEADFTMSASNVHRVVDVVLPCVNCTTQELKRLFTVENGASSLKFGLVLWALTYIGCCFNGLTLVILGFVAAFTVPKVYDTYKVQIDQQASICYHKFDEIYSKLKARIPYLKRKAE